MNKPSRSLLKMIDLEAVTEKPCPSGRKNKKSLKSFNGSYVLVFPARRSLPVLRLSNLFPRSENPRTFNPTED